MRSEFWLFLVIMGTAGGIGLHRAATQWVEQCEWAILTRDGLAQRYVVYCDVPVRDANPRVQPFNGRRLILEDGDE